MQRTGKTRHIPRTYSTGWGFHNNETVLVLQCEVAYTKTILVGGYIESCDDTKWVDAQAEWLMEE